MSARRRTKAIAAGVALVGSLALGGKYATTRANTVPIGPGSLQDRVIARAVVMPIDGTAEVRGRVEGRVTRVLVREGDVVRAGDLLAEIEATDLQAELSRRQAEKSALAATARSVAEGARVEERRMLDAELAAARQELDLATSRARREESLRASGSGTEVAAEEARHAVDMGKARVDAAEQRLKLAVAGGRPVDVRAADAKVAAAEAAIDETRTGLDRTRLVAPISGVVLARRIDPGDTVSAAGAATPLFELADVSRTEVRIEVEEHDALRLNVGMEVTISLSGGRPAVARGRIERLAARLERRTIGAEDARTRADGQIRAAWVGWLEPPANPVAVGQHLEAAVQLEPRSVQTLAPRSAVKVRDGRAVVAVPWGPLTRDLPVTLGAADDTNVELVGVSPGTRVVVP
jgi:multidrug resistance efflux pump